ncbi:MAG: 50S ribosomal protein L21 [Patescibacteria group bacterium]|nr:50S ribosomal protein L21 [Patescibacteria group bacterium]
MLVVIKTGGKQYKVKEGDTLKIEKIAGKEGDEVKFDEVLLVSDDEAKKVNVGTPLVEGVEVSAKILEQGRAKKVSVVKYKPKTRYRRNVGHRQPFTKVEIISIKAPK